MPPNSQGLWNDAKVNETVTSRFVHSHLRPDEAERLTNRVFGELSDQTYLEWVLTRAKRFFLILVDADVPDQIFGIIDDSYDDQDLPIPEESVADLKLSFQPNKAIDRRFYRTQFKYLTRVLGDGEHIRYAREEAVPVEVIGMKPIVNRDASDKVKLPSQPSRVFVRRRFSLDENSTELSILTEIAAFKRLSHQHVLSIFGSYTQDRDLFVLLAPAAEYTLKSFLNDLPKSFEALPKSKRRQTLLLWPHCIANAVSWLHLNGSYHGCIRPSRIQVDENYRICLGLFDGDWVLGQGTPRDDIESYQYAAPERWKRAVTVQSSTVNSVTFPSGGRTARRPGHGREDSASNQEAGGAAMHLPQGSINMSGPTSYAFIPTSKGNLSRLKLGTTTDFNSYAADKGRVTDSRQSNRTDDSQGTIRAKRDNPRNRDASSLQSSSSSGSDQRLGSNQIFAVTPEMRTAIVQTWKSVAHDLPAADIFSVGAVIMDIFTVLLKRSISAFAKHRSSRNRQAGRGGGLADASFHANLGMVATWAQGLCNEAEKKIKKEDGQMLNAVGPMLQVAMQCLDKEPSQRMTAEQLSQRLEEHLSDFASLNATHCTLQVPEELTQPSRSEASAPKNTSRTGVNTKQKEAPRHRDDNQVRRPNHSSHDKAVKRQSLPLSAFESPHHTRGHSFETQSVTMIAEDVSEDENWKHRTPRNHERNAKARKPQHPTKDSSRRQSRLHVNESDSEVDPTLSPSHAGTPRTFAFTNTSTSALSSTSDDQSNSSFTTYTTPRSNPPTRKLPAPPPESRVSKRQEVLSPKPASKSSSKSKSMRNVERATQQLSHTLRKPSEGYVDLDKLDTDDTDDYDDGNEDSNAYQNYSHPHAYSRRKTNPESQPSSAKLPHRTRP